MINQEVVEQDGTAEFVSLAAGGQGYCIEITSIREIRRWNSVTPLPNSENSILGVMNLRGAVIPIIDLAIQLGLEGTEISERSVIVVAAVGERVMGLLVGNVSEIISASKDAIQPNPTNGRDGSASQVVGLLSVNDTMLRVLDITSLLEEAAQGPVA